MHALNKNRFSKKRLLVSLGIIVIALAAFLFWYVVIFNGSILGWSLHSKEVSSHGPDYNKPSSQQTANGAQIKANSLNDSSKTGSSGSDTPPAPVPSSGGKSVAQMSITATNQTSSDYQIRTLISALSSGGSCTLTMTKPGATTVTQTSGVQDLSNTSTCQGFDVPLSELSSGTWNVTVNFSSSTLTGSAAKAVIIQ